MTHDQLAAQTQQNVALTLGQTTMKMVEAQTAADLLVADNEQLRAENARLQAEVATLKGEANPPA